MNIKSRCIFLMIPLLMLFQLVIAQTPGETVIDCDGNQYISVIIGTQTWLGANMNSVHYSDGTEIPGVVAYNNDESLAAIYGRLYTWNAAMNNSTIPGTQGVCPCGWHIPTDEEWSVLEQFLGGADIAGGKMKGVGTTYWNAPNTGADNSSGLNILPGGEYDGHYNPHIFQLINEYAVYWTSTNVNILKARQRGLSWESAKSSVFDWYKTMKYSIRCVKDTNTTAIKDVNTSPGAFLLKQNYPNPFNPSTIIEYYLPYQDEVSITLYNLIGEKVLDVYSGIQNVGLHKVELSATDLPAGLYFYQLRTTNINQIKSCLLVK